MILREISQYNFHDSNCQSLKAYFEKCEDEDASYHQSLKMEGTLIDCCLCTVKRKPTDISLRGMFSVLNRSHSALSLSAERGTSLSFYNHAVHANSGLNMEFQTNDQLSTIVENELNSLTDSGHLSSEWSPVSPPLSHDDSLKSYRRESVCGVVPGLLDEASMEVIDCPSICGSQMELSESVGL